MKISLLDLPAGTVCLNNLDPDGIPFAVFSFDGDSNSSLFYGSYHTICVNSGIFTFTLSEE